MGSEGVRLYSSWALVILVLDILTSGLLAREFETVRERMPVKSTLQESRNARKQRSCEQDIESSTIWPSIVCDI